MQDNDAIINELTTEPILTVTPFESEFAVKKETPPVAEEAHNALSESEMQQVRDFAAKIDLDNANMIMQYGALAQKKIAGFSESALNNIRTKDLGEIGEALTGLVHELKGFDAEEEEKGFRGIFKKTFNKAATLKTKYDHAEVNVDRISHILEDHQIRLLKDVAVLDKMYQLNLTYFKELTMYIIAGETKLAEVQATTLPALAQKAQTSGLPEDAQAANDLAARCDRFSKKLHDLALTKMVSVQMAPQIRLVQNNDTLMAEKIQSTLVNTIPLWKSQMVLALGMTHSQQAAAAQNEVDDMTNTLLRKNAEALKMSTIATAKAAERGIVDIETLQYTNQTLIATLDEVIKIQEDGRKKRHEAAQELDRLEDNMKQKMLEGIKRRTE